MLCPYCNGDSGFMVLEKVKRYLLFDSRGNADGSEGEETIYSGPPRCCECGKMLPMEHREEFYRAVKESN